MSRSSIRYRKNQASAFSLIELLIVIVLLSTLMAMLFPVFTTVREKVRATVCISNLRQIGGAVAMYAQDNDGVYPYATDGFNRYSPAWADNPTTARQEAQMPMLTDVLTGYIHNKNIWSCPSDTGLTLPQDLPGTDGSITLVVSPSAFAMFRSSYRYIPDLALNHIQYSSSGYYASSGMEVSPSLMRVVEDMNGRWHGETVTECAVFADGHAQALNESEFDATAGVVMSPPRPQL